MEVSEAQWDSAREIFYGKLGQDCGMAVEKYQRIKDLLCNWDTLSVPVRRERSGGNHVYWKKKYQVVGEQLCLLQPIRHAHQVHTVLAELAPVQGLGKHIRGVLQRRHIPHQLTDLR